MNQTHNPQQTNKTAPSAVCPTCNQPIQPKKADLLSIEVLTAFKRLWAEQFQFSALPSGVDCLKPRAGDLLKLPKFSLLLSPFLPASDSHHQRQIELGRLLTSIASISLPGGYRLIREKTHRSYFCYWLFQENQTNQTEQKVE